MAHFAELDENNIVTRVVVVSNDIETAAGPLGENNMHVDGETWCVNFFKGGTWKQTSYGHNFRKQYAGIGYTYDSSKDKFIKVKPYSSWSLDSNDDWQAPVTYPSITTYDSSGTEKYYGISWDEDNTRWTAYDSEESANSFNWDASALAWVSA
jgi:hypothetical protein|tara:strand:+ start:546 stop:1004 length:459 start_codon:yes stop_codon:yes gene_type:complete